MFMTTSSMRNIDHCSSPLGRWAGWRCSFDALRQDRGHVSDVCSNPIHASRLAYEPREIVMPPAKKAAPAAKKAAVPAKAAPQMTVTLKHLAAALSVSHDLPKKQAEAVLGDLVTLTTRHLKKGDKIRLSGLGILQVRKRAARMGRNPATGESIKIKASKKIAFRPAKEPKEAV
jgi:DNA-binding protein HU-beta